MSLANMSYSLNCTCAACGHNHSTVLDIFLHEVRCAQEPIHWMLGCWDDGPLNIIDDGEIFRR